MDTVCFVAPTCLSTTHHTRTESHFYHFTNVILFYVHVQIVTKTCTILHYWYNICMFIVTYLMTVCFFLKKFWCRLPEEQDNSVETCRSY